MFSPSCEQVSTFLLLFDVFITVMVVMMFLYLEVVILAKNRLIKKLEKQLELATKKEELET